ncbi:unnamed protein product [Penicillium glandicola]
MASPIPRGLRQVLQKSPNDIVILSSLRTPVTRAKKGGFKDAYPEELLASVLQATLKANPNLDPAQIDDVLIGSVLQELGGAKAGRMGQIHAGFPHSVPFNTMNRQCSSGLAAITTIANGIRAGAINIGVGGGMESMTRNYGSRAIPTVLWPELKESYSQDARDCIMPMGITSENVASRYGISRADQDAFAVESHAKASAAQKAGRFDSEIVSVTTKTLDPENPDAPAKDVTVSKDDGIRHGLSFEKVSSLKPAFSPTGASTAGNSSQVSDGAAAALLMRRSTAEELGLSGSIKARWVASAVAGCAPDEMGVGPAVAIPKLLQTVGVEVADVGVWEINEAFASQALYSVRKLGIDQAKVNPNGGAIAIGHPLGATGARQLATLLPELERSGQEIGVISMCIGTGMGMAGMFVRLSLRQRSEHQNAKHQDHRHVTRACLEFVSPSSPTPLARRFQTAFAPTIIMRPSMRLPLREANFICSSCRIGATPRISPLGQARRYASDSPGILDRARRKIWGTDNPPGPADPYSGSQIMPGSGLSSGVEPESKEGFSLEQGEAQPEELEENLTWEGMPKIGYLKEKEWRIKGPKGQDRIRPWYYNPHPSEPLKAVHQAAVEIGLMQLLGKKVTVSSEHQFAAAQLKSVRIEGQSGNWGDRLRFPDNKTMETLLRRVAGTLEGEAAESAFQDTLKKLAGEPEKRLYGANGVKSKGQTQKSLSSLPLSDGNIKFAFFARISKLMSQHIPDHIITSSATTGDVFRAQEALRKKTTRLTPTLLHEIMDKNGAAELPNVKILDARQTRHDNDEDLGRKKAIVSGLYKSGLITKSLGQKQTPPWKQANKTDVTA